MASEAAELVGFLKDGRAEVARLALDHIVGLTGSEDGLSSLRDSTVVASLHWFTTRPDPADEDLAKACTALVNLASSPIYARQFQLQAKRFCGSVTQLLCDFASAASLAASQFERNRKWTIVDLCCMLLTNLTQTEEGVNCLLQKGEELEGLYVCKLLDIFVRFSKPGVTLRKSEANHPLAYVASVLMNITQSEVGQRLLMDPKRGIMSHLILRLTHEDELIRKGTAGTIKNCLYGLPISQLPPIAYISDAEESQSSPQLVLHLVLPLIRSDELLPPSDMTGMPDLWLERNRDIKKKVEPSKEVRQAILECLLLLARSRDVREYMRKVQVYPIIRNLDMKEEEESIKDLIYKLVELLMLDEDPQSSSSSSSSS